MSFNIILFADSEKNGIALKNEMKTNGFSEISVFSKLEAFTTEISGTGYDLIVISVENDTDKLNQLIKLSCERTSSFVILITGEAASKAFTAQCEKYGVIILKKPISRSYLLSVLNILSNAKVRIDSIKCENTRLKTRYEQMKLINRAKLTLMRCLNMSEDTAHHYIEKQAMNLHLSKNEIAEQILNTYEN